MKPRALSQFYIDQSGATNPVCQRPDLRPTLDIDSLLNSLPSRTCRQLYRCHCSHLHLYHCPHGGLWLWLRISHSALVKCKQIHWTVGFLLKRVFNVALKIIKKINFAQCEFCRGVVFACPDGAEISHYSKHNISLRQR